MMPEYSFHMFFIKPSTDSSWYSGCSMRSCGKCSRCRRHCRGASLQQDLTLSFRSVVNTITCGKLKVLLESKNEITDLLRMSHTFTFLSLSGGFAVVEGAILASTKTVIGYMYTSDE